MTTWLMRLVIVLLAMAGTASAQTGVVIPNPVFEPDLNTGSPCALCKLYSYEAGTTTPLAVWTDAALSVAHPNPVVLDSSGRAAIYLNPALGYKFVLTTSDGTTIWTRDSVIGPLSGVVTVQAANTRGVQISRSSAEAGLSICSNGGSGKCYALLSNTSGGSRWQDDTDGTPRLELLANDITATLSGTFTVSGGTTALGTTTTGALTTTGATSLGSTLAVNGASTFADNIITSQTIPRFTLIETDATANNKRWAWAAEAEQLSLQAVNDAASVGTVAISIDRTTTTVDAVNLAATATTNTGRYNSATLQPGVLAYNSAADNAVATGATVDFDAEVYDEAGNFASDTFTAPVAGRYLICATVTYSDNAAATYGLRIVTSARSYRIDWSGATTSGVSNGCVHADLALAATASIQVDTGDGTGITIEGGASPLSTFVSIRLVP